MNQILNRRTLISLTIRSYFIRLFYNYVNLFGEGVCLCLFPVTNEDKEYFLKQNYKFFNTNEYLSGFALGIILKTKNEQPEVIEKTRDILSSVMGSVGDRLLYKLIFPIIVLTALNMFTLSNFTLSTSAVILVISEIVMFNFFSFYLRYYGIKNGFEMGIDSIRIFKGSLYKKIILIFTLIRNILVILLILNLIVLLFR